MAATQVTTTLADGERVVVAVAESAQLAPFGPFRLGLRPDRVAPGEI